MIVSTTTHYVRIATHISPPFITALHHPLKPPIHLQNSKNTRLCIKDNYYRQSPTSTSPTSIHNVIMVVQRPFYSPRPGHAHAHNAPRRRPQSVASAGELQMSTLREESITLAETKMLKKLFDTGPKLMEGFRLIVEAYTGTTCDDHRLQSSVKSLLREKVSSALTILTLENCPKLFIIGR